MIDSKIYGEYVTAWCPGCGNHDVLLALKDALARQDLEPHQFALVSGIGQAAKIVHYVRGNGFNGLHGRALPPAQALKLVNPELKVVVESGDGCTYGEGGNHLLAAIRRNLDITLIVHNNQIYGLTKGQSSPTTMTGHVTKNNPLGVFEGAFIHDVGVLDELAQHVLGDQRDGDQRQGAGRELLLGQDVNFRIMVVADRGGDLGRQPPVAGQQPAHHRVVAAEALLFLGQQRRAAVLGGGIDVGVFGKVRQHHRDRRIVEEGVGVGALGRDADVPARQHAGGQGQGGGARPEPLHQRREEVQQRVGPPGRANPKGAPK